VRTPYRTYSAGFLVAEWLKTTQRRREPMKHKKQGPEGAAAAGDAAADAAKTDHPVLPEVNEARIVGRLTNTPRVKNYGEGKDRAQFIVAVPRPKRKADAKPASDYITVVAWGALAKQCEGIGKGDGVQVEGRIQTWTDPENKRLHWEISADGLEVLDRAARADADSARGEVTAGV
jgi:single-strand DNA-binding protein